MWQADNLKTCPSWTLPELLTDLHASCTIAETTDQVHFKGSNRCTRPALVGHPGSSRLEPRPQTMLTGMPALGLVQHAAYTQPIRQLL